jgi:hypothetical protein
VGNLHWGFLHSIDQKSSEGHFFLFELVEKKERFASCRWSG